MKKIFFLIYLFSLSLCLLSQNHELYDLMKERNEFYFSFEYDDNLDIDEIAKIISIDRIEEGRIVAYANNKDYECFLRYGYDTKLLTPPSMMETYEMFDGTTRTGYDWDEYPTYEAYEVMMEEFALTYPDKCALMELGTLASGRKILLLRINDGDISAKPKFLLASTIHGDETTGFVMMLRLIDLLLSHPELPEVENVINNIDLFVCPNANPDGTYYGGNHTVRGAKRFNACSIDMNRNYPDPVDGMHPDGNEYAAETQWFMKLAEDYDFTMAAHYHGGVELVNYPWDNDYTRHADDEWWQMISRQYAELAHEKDADYMTDEENGITNGADWYRIGGGRQDYMNYYHRCRELTIECSAIKCPPASKLTMYWEYNYNSIFALLNQVTYGIQGLVIDAEDKTPLEATIRILNHDQNYSVVKSRCADGSFFRPIKSGAYMVDICAEGYKPERREVVVDDNEKKYLLIELCKNSESYSDIDCESQSIKIANIGDDAISVKCEYLLGDIEWNVLNLQSQIVKKSYETQNSFNINVSDLEAGIYILKVCRGGKQEVRKIVVR